MIAVSPGLSSIPKVEWSPPGNSIHFFFIILTLFMDKSGHRRDNDNLNHNYRSLKRFNFFKKKSKPIKHSVTYISH